MLGWPHITAGEHSLICAPTGSGKTLTAFMSSIDRLTTTPRPEERSHRTRVLYISPLRALAFDIEKNLRAPLKGIEFAAERLGEAFTAPEVGMRTGDVILAINGVEIAHPDEVATVLGGQVRRIEMLILRGTRRVSLRFRI